ncbi:protein ALWAYS EARLY 3 isoform X1 [Arachis stenosperma]|uniref:protein ALWAYS EARLY 3 isoform X1 n=2 Tax=Arachis stenosperma TaxID=217475 RepID=UPI0025AB8664|nr:protein ALWAYS EARLY 3 isoform X1 [Arachis stenosperma]
MLSLCHSRLHLLLKDSNQIPPQNHCYAFNSQFQFSTIGCVFWILFLIHVVFREKRDSISVFGHLEQTLEPQIMAPSKKSRSVNKRFPNVREAASSKDKNAENASKNKQKASPGTQKKRKLADMLGPQWSKEELEHFYEAYRKYGKDWKKVSLAVRNRSVEMVEALYTMNRAYLSLPEGTASVVGLIAMMTDHYSVLGGSDSEKESNEDAEVSKRSQKRLRKKQMNDHKTLEGPFSDHSQSQSVASGDGCLSLLKTRNSGLTPHAVRKRTPRVPISHSIGKDNAEKLFSSARQGRKQMVDTNDVTHKIALALAEASQRGGSSKISASPNKRAAPSPSKKSGKKVKSEIAGSKFCSSDLDGGSSELSLGSTEGDNGDYNRKTVNWTSRENTGKGRNREKRVKHTGNNLEPEESLNMHLDEIKEASSGTDDGKNLNFIKSNFSTDFANAKNPSPSSYKGSKKRSKKLQVEKDEASAFDALKTLADLSLMMPVTNADSESSAQVREGNHDVEESKVKMHKATKIERTASSALGKIFSDGAAISEGEGVYQLNAGIRKRKQKSFSLNNDETHTDSHLSGSQKIKDTDEVKKSMVKGKRSSVSTTYPRQPKLVKSPGKMSSSGNDKREGDDSTSSPIKVSSANQVGQVNKGRPRRKMGKPKPMAEGDPVVSGNIFSSQHNKSCASVQNSSSSPKGKLINCLSSHQARRWCTFEWFYSAIDYPWFSKREFVEYLDHVGLGHVPRLTRIEWGVIRSSLGKPRRFSEQFLIEEKQKLNQYRESVRSHYAEVLAGTKEGLPTDLARPLIVGQRVIAIHPKTREIHNGSILTVDHCRCLVQFDQRELGAEFVMDIDCMPMYPFENMPTSMARHHVAHCRINETFNDLRLNGKLKQEIIADHTILSPSETIDTTKGLHILPTKHGSSTLSNQGVSPNSKSQVKAMCNQICNAQQAPSLQPLPFEHVHSKEADISAISELTRALDKKELVMSELKVMNDGVSESQKYGDNSLKDSESFKRSYASLIKHLTEVNEQVSSALFRLRQRNTYQGSTTELSLKPIANYDDPGGQASSSNCSACHNQESIPLGHIAEIVESSRRKARAMVVQATQAMSIFMKTDSKVEKIEDAINFINNQLSVDDPAAPATNSLPADSIHITLASQDQLTGNTLNPSVNCHAQDAEFNSSSDQNEMKIPSELISHCLATLLMIQKCTERQFPPADVAQVLDSAVTSLQPFCSKNLPIYGEIQKCMGIIRNQILALIPT